MRESVNNTTVLPLLNGDTFSGIWERGIFPEIMVSCVCDSSATLYFDFSVDGKNYTTEPPVGFAVTSDVTLVKTAIKGLRWFRIRLVAGGTQTYLRLYTYYGTFNQLWSPTSALQEDGNDSLASIDSKLTNPLPVSGSVSTNGLTDTQLRAAAVPVSLASVPSHAVTGTFWQATQPVSISAASVLFKGRASTFRTLGRAGTTGQKILSLHNATGSAVTVTMNKVIVDMWCTVVKVITVAPPIIRVWKVTVLPTNGTALAKTKIGGTTTSNASVTVLGDASADGTGSGTTLTATLPAGTFIEQRAAPRFITGAGYEMVDSMEFLSNTEVTLAALEGIVVFLDYTLATQNPVTDMWIATVDWTEK